jgi:hypothetical protein
MNYAERIAVAVDYQPQYFKDCDREDLNFAAQVWVDKIIGKLGEHPSEYSRFGWMAEERAVLEDILHVAHLLARGAIPSRSPARILYRLTKADTPTAIMSHTVTLHQNGAGRLVLDWTAQIKEMGK